MDRVIIFKVEPTFPKISLEVLP